MQHCAEKRRSQAAPCKSPIMQLQFQGDFKPAFAGASGFADGSGALHPADFANGLAFRTPAPWSFEDKTRGHISQRLLGSAWPFNFDRVYFRVIAETKMQAHAVLGKIAAPAPNFLHLSQVPTDYIQPR